MASYILISHGYVGQVPLAIKMTTLRVSLIAAASGIVGALLGAFFAAKFVGSLVGYGTAVSSLATIAVEGSALEKIAAGDVQGAQQVLNLRLDGELITLNSSVNDGFQLPSRGAEVLARLKRYDRPRAMFRAIHLSDAASNPPSL